MIKKNYIIKLIFMVVTLCWFGVACASGNNIPLSELPETVVQSAEGAVEGFVIKEAERKERDGKIVYEVEGYVDNKKYELKIDSEGKVLKVEKDD